jgi:U3 small nucleolar ribonucleoprotein component
MSIFDPTSFFNTPFVESVEYYVSGIVEPITIDAIVTRHKRKPYSQKGFDPQQIYYPVELMIKREDIDSVNVKRDMVTITDNRGNEDSITIQEVLSCDSGVWNLGAV